MPPPTPSRNEIPNSGAALCAAGSIRNPAPIMTKQALTAAHSLTARISQGSRMRATSATPAHRPRMLPVVDAESCMRAPTSGTMKKNRSTVTGTKAASASVRRRRGERQISRTGMRAGAGLPEGPGKLLATSARTTRAHAGMRATTRNASRCPIRSMAIPAITGPRAEPSAFAAVIQPKFPVRRSGVLSPAMA